ncbi:acetate--CoA ligase family protein [Pseudonocardia acaciae]|uniref:acetate--CoA ligase family protein n=1 Tax=Pseudonocardia acaciae TaxID=551276 RepID=UPI00048C105E|nr:acetate--CoA ligase family protein [Pseudonocardia acaciae]
MTTGLDRLLNPSGIAVVGASDDPARIGGRPLRLLADRGYAGRVYPVNPKYVTAQGLTCYPDIDALPPGIDLYVICLPAQASVRAVEQAGARGAGAAVVFSGGFAEAGAEGRELQRRLAAAADAHGVALMGPNCLGFASLAHGAVGTFSTAMQTLPELPAGDVALVAQSGGMAFNLLAEATWAGARFSHVITSGNEAVLTFADYLAYLAADEHTRAVIGYLEGAGDGAALARSLELLRQAGKPTFLIKTGTSERGVASVASHTAQLSGDDDAFEALFRRYGVTRLATVDDAVDVARALGVRTPADGLSVATNSGGTGVYVVDTADRYGIPLADPTEATRERLAGALPGFAGTDNPIDMTAQVINDNTLLPKTLDALDADAATDLVLVVLGSMEYLADELIDTLATAQERITTPLLLSWYGVAESVRLRAAAAGLRVCADPARALRGVGLVRRGLAAVRSARGGVPSPDSPTITLPALEPRTLPGGRRALDEWQAMGLLDGLGVALPARRLAHSEIEAAEAAREIGFPVVLKLLDPMLAHRARVGAVLTALADEAAVREAFAALRRDHGARRVLLARQVEPGPELIAGVLADPVFGTRAVVGSGGVWAEDVDDVRTLVPPYDAGSVADALADLRLSTLYRRAADPTALAAQVAALLTGMSALVTASAGRITEIECNPVVVTGEAATVLDALAFSRDTEDG